MSPGLPRCRRDAHFRMTWPSCASSRCAGRQHMRPSRVGQVCARRASRVCAWTGTVRGPKPSWSGLNEMTHAVSDARLGGAGDPPPSGVMRISSRPLGAGCLVGDRSMVGAVCAQCAGLPGYPDPLNEQMARISGRPRHIFPGSELFSTAGSLSGQSLGRHHMRGRSASYAHRSVEVERIQSRPCRFGTEIS